MISFKWDADPRGFLKDIETTIERKTEIVAQRFFESVVSRSPVDSGSYRASWNVSINSPEVVFRKGGSTDNPQSAPVWPGFKVKFGESIFITNGAPYWEKIENGWSGQAPYGVVRVALSGLE